MIKLPAILWALATTLTASNAAKFTFTPEIRIPTGKQLSTVFRVPSEMGVCLDGSDPAYYFRAGNASSKWYIHMEGGGWCYTPEECVDRASTSLGSSLGYSDTQNFDYDYMSTDPALNPLMHDWNSVYIKYCDGASFSGMKIEPTNVDGYDLYFRGKYNLDAILNDMVATKGLGSATDIVVSGCSAGGLATYLHVDQYAERFGETARVVGMPDSGFFLDWEDAGVCGETESIGYESDMANVFAFQNATSGVNARCVSAHEEAGDTWKCMFAEYTAPHIVTPVFALQSQYDSWQLGCDLSEDATVAQVNAYGANLTARLKSSLIIGGASGLVNGAFLDSCYHHCGGWSTIPIAGETQSTAFAKWYNGTVAPDTLYTQNKAYPCDDCCE